MINVLIILFFAMAFTTAVFILLLFISFDRAMKAIYISSKERWSNIGEPIGFFWIPLEKQSDFLRGSYVRNALAMRLIWEKLNESNTLYEELVTVNFMAFRLLFRISAFLFLGCVAGLLWELFRY